MWIYVRLQGKSKETSGETAREEKATVEVPKASKQAKIFHCDEFQYICGYKFNLKYHMAQMHYTVMKTEVLN